MGLSLLQDRMRGIMIQLQTKFSRQVDEHNVLPEYPRPSLVRTSYLNLNGRWECAFSKTPEIPLSFDLSILVPFSPECQLSGVSRQLKPGEYLWYRRTIPLAKPQQDKRILLHFGAADQTAEVFVNRISAVRHCGGYLPFSADITDYLQEGDNELIVRIQDESNTSWHARGKQSLKPGGMFYTAQSGLWQTVWMEAVHPEGLQSVQLLTDIDQQQLVVRPRFYKEAGGKLQVTLKDNGKVVASRTVSASSLSSVVLPVKKMKTWSPESPFLYDLEYKVLDKNGNIIDEVNGYAGMRKVHIEGNKIYLNNKPYYQRLVLDQGFYPDGIWTAPSDEALKRDIELSMEAGFNGARLHQKVFEERFYYWADKMGYLTWGEASSWGMDCNDTETARNFITEWSEIVQRDRNHPSLLIWTPTNEEFWPDRVQYPRLMHDLYNLTKMIDPTRPFHGASGGTHIATDIWTVHNYEQDPAKLKEKLYNGGKLMEAPKWEIHLMPMNIGYNGLKYTDQYAFPEYKKDMPYLVDEFGGIKWNPSQQMESAQNTSWGYGEPPRSLEEFYARLEGQVDAVLSLSNDIWGYCYTQLTDVEQEQNGIYYYDRTPKFDMKRIHAIFSKTPESK